MKKFNDDTFLARWLSNDLSEKERKEFEASADFPIYQKIVAGTSKVKSPEVDLEALLESIKKTQRTTVQPHQAAGKKWIYGIAASLLLLISLTFMGIRYMSPTVVAAGFGEKKHLTLPDGSEVILNAKSKVSYKERNWEDNRSISLIGEAYFKVAKGKKFEVVTDQGKVTVLGTQFDVQSVDDFFQVVCYEGKVAVTTPNQEQILEPEKGFRQFKDQSVSFDHTGTSPSWIQNESTFKGIPLKYVLKALGNQFQIEFNGYEPTDQLTFTGSFPHDNKEVALRIVLGAVGIDYQINQNTVTLTK